MPDLFYSAASDGALSAVLGEPHYSYRFAEAKFLALFQARGLAARRLAMPEYYGTRAALPQDESGPGTGHGTGGDPGPPAHLMFRSTEQIRLLKCGYNVACFPWEFSVLKVDTLAGEHPFRNQKRMLGLCDEVWTACTFTERVLQTHGIDNIHVIPAPITIPSGPRPDRYDALIRLGQLPVVPFCHNFLLSPAQNRAVCAQRATSLAEWLAPRLSADAPPTIYLAILNPEDFRKNLDALLRGFHAFQARFPTALLIVKLLTSATRYDLASVAGDVVPSKLAPGSVFDSDNIVLTHAFLAEPALSCLYQLADFYLCTSVAEGQNLPLQEAMAHGTVPVTTRNTAMSDYIDEDHAFVIHARPVANESPHMAGTIAGRPFNIAVCKPRAVYEALAQSIAAPPDKRARMQRNCIARIERDYSADAVWPRISERLAAAAGAGVGAGFGAP